MKNICIIFDHYYKKFNKYQRVLDPGCLHRMQNYVCRFAQQWEDFRLPELVAVAQIQNVPIDYDVSDYSNEVF